MQLLINQTFKIEGFKKVNNPKQFSGDLYLSIVPLKMGTGVGEEDFDIMFFTFVIKIVPILLICKLYIGYPIHTMLTGIRFCDFIFFRFIKETTVFKKQAYLK